MARSSFRLDTVLRVRKIHEDLARQSLAVANRSLVKARADRDRRVEHYYSLASPTGRRSYEEFMREQQVLSLAADSVSFGQHNVEAAQVFAAREREQYLAARKKVKIIEKLEERFRAEKQYAENVADVKSTDDLVTTRWARDMSTAGAVARAGTGAHAGGSTA